MDRVKVLILLVLLGVALAVGEIVPIYACGDSLTGGSYYLANDIDIPLDYGAQCLTISGASTLDGYQLLFHN